MPFFLNQKTPAACETLFEGKDSPRVVFVPSSAKLACIFRVSPRWPADSLALLGISRHKQVSGHASVHEVRR
jgi:hypothetical protein